MTVPGFAILPACPFTLFTRNSAHQESKHLVCCNVTWTGNGVAKYIIYVKMFLRPCEGCGYAKFDPKPTWFSTEKDQNPRRRRSFQRCTKPSTHRSAASEPQLAPSGLEMSWGPWWTRLQTFSSSRSCRPPPGTRFIASYYHTMLPPKDVFVSKSLNHALTHFQISR